MENFRMNAGRTDDVANICLTRSQFMAEKFMAADHVELDASTLLEHQYVNEEGRTCGIDAAPFWQRVYRCAAEVQAVKYPDGEDRLLQIPESCVVEVKKKADNANGDAPGHLVEAARNALQRLRKLLHEFKVLKVIPDAALGEFGDSALCAAAMHANSRQRLLFITQDQGLGRDLLSFRELECFRTRHEVYRFDQYGFLSPIRQSRTTQQANAGTQTAPRQTASGQTAPRQFASGQTAPRQAVSGQVAPMSRERGHGSIHNFRFNSPAPNESDCALEAAGRMKPGDRLYLIDGTSVILGGEIGSGNEAQVFAIEGDDDRCVKVILNPTFYKQQRVNLLCSRDFEIDGCIFPDAPLSVDAEGRRFKGYVMRRIPDNASAPLAALFHSRLRSRYLPEGADRRFYARLALTLAQLFYRIHLRGILLCDVSAGNVRVALNDDGKAVPDRLYLIDVDSAQLGTEACTYSGDGITPAYMAPELHRSGWNGALIPYSAELFSASLLICQALLCGAHPFTALDVAADEPFDECEAVREGRFPYGSSTERRAVGTKAPGARAYLWSNMPSRLKDAFHSAMTAAPQDRPKLQELIPLLESYNAWIGRDETLERYPMIRSLLPTAYKPFLKTCCACGHEVDAANNAGGVMRGDVFMCPECAAQPAARCGNPGCDHVTLTRGEELLGRRARALCPECFEKQKAAQAEQLSHYSTCKCGRSFAVRVSEVRNGNAPALCPACRAAAAQAAAACPDPANAPGPAEPHQPDGSRKVRTIRQYLEEMYRILAG